MAAKNESVTGRQRALLDVSGWCSDYSVAMRENDELRKKLEALEQVFLEHSVDDRRQG